MFRSSTIIRELVLNLAKVIFMLKHSVKLRRFILYIVYIINYTVYCTPLLTIFMFIREFD